MWCRDFFFGAQNIKWIRKSQQADNAKSCKKRKKGKKSMKIL